MNEWILLIISMAFCLLGGICAKVYINKYVSDSTSRYVYSGMRCLASGIALLIINGKFNASPFTIALGIGFGLITAIQGIFSLKALEIGPWAYTNLFSSFSTIISALSGVMFWNEKISFVQIIGISLMLLCIYLSTDLKEKDDTKKVSSKWLLYCIVIFFMTGFIGVMQKWHQNTPFKDELCGFLVVAFSVAFVYSMAVVIRDVIKNKSNDVNKADYKKLFGVLPLFITLVAGISAALNNQFNLYL